MRSVADPYIIGKGDGFGPASRLDAPPRDLPQLRKFLQGPGIFLGDKQ